jgi:hypothetical protein
MAKVGGHLIRFANAWHFITDEMPRILNIVASDNALDFIEQPLQHAFPVDSGGLCPRKW